MKRYFLNPLVLIFGFFACRGTFLNAEDDPIDGGLSPDGRYEVRIFETNMRAPSNYFYGVVDTKNGKLFKELAEGGGYALYSGAKETAKVLWHPSGKFFALIDHGGRHSMDLYVYEVTPRDVGLVKTPDYYANALGRIGATQGYLIEVVKPISWDNDILTCSLAFDATLPENKGRSPVYVTEFKLELMHGLYQASELNLKEMSPPKEDQE